MPKINEDQKTEKPKQSTAITSFKIKNNDYFPKDNSYSVNDLSKKSSKGELPASNNFFVPSNEIPQIQQEAPAKTSAIPAQSLQIRREDILPGDIIISVGSVDPDFSEEFLKKAFDEYNDESFERLAPLGSRVTLAQMIISNSSGHNDSVHAGLCVGFDNEGSCYDLVLQSEDDFFIPGKIFISINESNNYFDYFLFDPKGNRIEGKIQIDDLTNLRTCESLTIHHLRAVKNEILAITLQRGHTDCKTPIIRDLHGKVQDMSIYKYYIPTTMRVFRPNIPSHLFEKSTENILYNQDVAVKNQWNNRHRCNLLKLSKLPDSFDNLSHSHYILVKNDKKRQFCYYNAFQKELRNFSLNDNKFLKLEELFNNFGSDEQLDYFSLIHIEAITKHSHLQRVALDRFYMPGKYTSKWDNSKLHCLKIGLTPSNFFAPANTDELKIDEKTICSKLIIQSYKILLTHIARYLQIEDEHDFVRNYMNLIDNTLPKTLEGYLKANVNYTEMIIPTHSNPFERIGEIIKREGADKLQALYAKLNESSDEPLIKASKFLDEAKRLGLKMPEKLQAFLASQAIETMEKSQKGSHHNLAEQYENGKKLLDTMLKSEVIKKSPELQAQIQEQYNQFNALWQHHENNRGFFDRNLGFEASTLATTALIAGGLCYLTSRF